MFLDLMYCSVRITSAPLKETRQAARDFGWKNYAEVLNITFLNLPFFFVEVMW